MIKIKKVNTIIRCEPIMRDHIFCMSHWTNEGIPLEFGSLIPASINSWKPKPICILLGTFCYQLNLVFAILGNDKNGCELAKYGMPLWVSIRHFLRSSLNVLPENELREWLYSIRWLNQSRNINWLW